MRDEIPVAQTLAPLTVDDFARFYEAAHGYAPFAWQQRLSKKACQGEWPDYVKLPTSSGKTAAIDIAVFALAYQACKANRVDGHFIAARRIFFVVDRRIIVNEAYRATRKTAQLLWEAVNRNDTDSILWQVASWLRTLSGDEKAPPLDCRELRGGIYRDDAWVRSPLQPTVLTSTVDQVGSRMLFRGYGVSDRNLPIHAAMTTCDSLIILDEAHCSRPFSQTVESVAKYRGEKWSREPIATPFHLVQMTATAPSELGDKKLFSLEEYDYEVNPLLDKRHACAKPTRLVFDSGAKGRTLPARLAKTLFTEATKLSEQGCRKIALVVNRVAIARETFKKLEANHGERARLMIGRMRPIDREVLTTELQNRFASGADWKFEEPQFVVATQCLEVGADLDFDGMVSQCASLDSLRQRFGRLNRLGDAEHSHGVIVAAEEDTADEAKLNDANPIDPVYGNSLARTWRWLNDAKNENGVIDFGIKPMDALIAEKNADMRKIVAPALDAPVLMPAHMDMFCQTSPRPTPEPHVADYLHGPDRGIPEVRVCWRADLKMMLPETREARRNRTRLWHETVAACPPSSAECLSVPMYIVKKWLRGEPIIDTTSDVIGEAPEEDKADRKIHDSHNRCLLVWKPEERISKKLKPSDPSDDKKTGSQVISKFNADRLLRTGDTIVIPAQFGGWEEFGHVPAAPAQPDPDAWVQAVTGTPTVEPVDREFARIDVADKAFSQSRARTILRIHSQLFVDDIKKETLEELLRHIRQPDASLRVEDLKSMVTDADANGEDAQHRNTDTWAGTRLERLTQLGGKVVRYPDGLAWTSALHPDRAQGLPPLSLASFGDATDDLSETGRLALIQHLADVFAEATRITNHIALSDRQSATIAMAAKLHDIGKADPRFQALLLGKSVSVAHMQRTLWAKSDKFGGSRSSELPDGFRHEMLSVNLVPKCILADEIDAELLSHTIAAHHGYARPLAPVAVDSSLPGFRLESLGLEDVSHEDRSQWTPSYQLDSHVADRFWQLTRQFGWWGIAYLESVLRLADWFASANPGKGNPDSVKLSAPPAAQGNRTAKRENSNVVLSGIDGSRPLGFLAAIGVFRLLGMGENASAYRFAWTQSEGAWRPIIVCDGADHKVEDEIVDEVLSLLGDNPNEHPSLRIDAPEDGRRAYFQAIVDNASLENRTDADWLSCNESDAADAAAISQLQTSRRDYHSIAIRGLLTATTRQHLGRTLLHTWDYADPIAGVSLHLEPREDRRHAYQWFTPSGDPTRKSSGGMIGANRLALEAWPVFQSLPAKSRDRLTTVAFRGARVTDTSLSWPLWTTPISLDAIGTLLSHRSLPSADDDAEQLLPLGVARVYRCNRILVGKTPNLTSASAVMTG